jgi:hypothetical protein
MRYLRFSGLRPRAFREFVFRIYFRKLLLTAFLLIVPVTLAVALLFFDTTGLLVAASMIFTAVISFRLARVLMRRFRQSDKEPAIKEAVS